MIETEAFDELVSCLYDAVVDRDAWPRTLARLRAGFNSSIASLNTYRQGCHASISTDPAASAEFARHWAAGNLLTAKKMPVGSVALAEDLVAREELVASAYYNEFLLPHDIPQVMIIKGPLTESGGMVVNVLRGRRQPEFSKAELGLANRLSSHIVTAWRTGSMLGWKSWTELIASLETARDAMVLVDEAGTILHMNRSARALIETRDGIVAGGRRLDAAFPLDGKRLRAAIWQAASAPSTTGAMLAIERPSGARALIASVSPLAVALVDIGVPRPRALIAILDPERAVPAPAAELQRLFGLTRREADVAQALAEGLTVAEAAQHCGITLATARNHLASVLRKTQLNRQAELVSLLNGLCRLSEAGRRS